MRRPALLFLSHHWPSDPARRPWNADAARVNFGILAPTKPTSRDSRELPRLGS
ncbi:hypothetical protein ACVIGA_007529 [Bradyrhizobium sp. USDA 3240]